MSRRPIIDASAFICWINEEPGADRVAELLERRALMSAVNWAEVASKYADDRVRTGDMAETLALSHMTIVPFDADLAWRAGLLRATTRHLGLSLGDRACLALAERLEGVAVTCDRAWREVAGVAVELVRP